jgi:hypothetical protein
MIELNSCIFVVFDDTDHMDVFLKPNIEKQDIY